MNPLPTPDQAVRRLMDARGRVAPPELHLLSGTGEPGMYAWFADGEGAGQLADGIGLAVRPGLIYAGQAGAVTSRATLGSRIRGDHLGSDIYGSTFRLTLASAMGTRLGLEPIGGGHMSRDGEGRLSDWMRQHLMVSVIATAGRSSLPTILGAPVSKGSVISSSSRRSRMPSPKWDRRRHDAPDFE